MRTVAPSLHFARQHKSGFECADRVILEVNSWQSIDLEGMHDVYYGLDVLPAASPFPSPAPDSASAAPTSISLWRR